MDGTLVDNSKIIVQLFQEIVSEYLQKQMSEEEVIALWGPPGDEIFKKIFPPDILTNAWPDFLNRYREFQPDSGFFTKDQLNELKKIVPHLAIFTGKSRPTLSISLEKLGLTESFDMIMTGNDVERSKPYPDALFRIIEAFKLNKSETLFLGDSPLDVMAGKSAGIKTAAALWGSLETEKLLDSKPDYIFKTPEEFMTFILTS